MVFGCLCSVFTGVEVLSQGSLTPLLKGREIFAKHRTIVVSCSFVKRCG